MSCDKILQHDWTALYSAAGQGLYTQFTRPFPLLRKWVWLARLALIEHTHETAGPAEAKLHWSPILTRNKKTLEMQKDVGMAHQKICRQGRYDIKIYKAIYIAVLTSFSTTELSCEKDAGRGLCIFTFTFISYQPCSHTFWCATPTSFTFLMFFIFLFLYLFDVISQLQLA